MARTQDIIMRDTAVAIMGITSSPITAGIIAITARSRTISIATTAIMRHSNSLTSMAVTGIAITAIAIMAMLDRSSSLIVTTATTTALTVIMARTVTISSSRIMAITGTVATTTTLLIIAITAPGIAWPEPIMARIKSLIAIIMAKVLTELRDIMSSSAGPIAENTAATLVLPLMGLTVTISSQASASMIGLLPDRTVIGGTVIGGTVIGDTGITPALPDRMPVRVPGPALALTIKGASRNSNEKLTTCFGWSLKYGKR